MRRLWNPVAAIITFFIGVACTAIWLIGGQIFQKAEAPNIPPVYLLAQDYSDLDVEAEKYQVYSALIEDMYVDGHTGLLVIEDGNECSASSNADKLSERQEEEMGVDLEGYAFKQFPELKRETIADFHMKAQECFSLNKQFDVPINYVIVNRKEIDSLFAKHGVGGWELFYAKYPVSFGFISLSNVGFNKEMTQAFVSTSRSCGGLCGEGNLVLLKKEYGVWKVQAKQMTWVS